MPINFFKSIKSESKPKGVLTSAPEDKAFVTCDGRSIKNSIEMAAALREMGNDVFKHHVNGERNDFAVWTKDVLADRRLARDMRRSRTLPTFIRKVESRLKELE